MNKGQETNETEMYKAYFEMMKEWIIRDYYNPSFKAEVVLDTMLSEFICELLQYGFGDDRKFTRLAKEFPVKKLESKKQESSEENDKGKFRMESLFR